MNTPRFFTAALLLTVILGAMACGPGEPAVTQIVVEVTATPSPRPTRTPIPIVVEVTATPSPRPTRTPIPTIILPTATPMPPVSINSDCVGCPVVVPGAWGNQQVLGAYFEWSGASKHPGKVLLVTCSRGDNVYSLGEIMGARGSGTLPKDIAVKGLGVVSKGTCYAITARYDGLQDACIENVSGQCRFGTGGEDIEILGFDRIGQKTEISGSQYDTLLKYAHNTEYQAAGK